MAIPLVASINKIFYLNDLHTLAWLHAESQGQHYSYARSCKKYQFIEDHSKTVYWGGGGAEVKLHCLKCLHLLEARSETTSGRLSLQKKGGGSYL